MSEDDSVKHEGKWTRDDFPASLPDAEGVYGPSILVPSVRRDLAAWLNAHHPKQECRCNELRSLVEGQKEHVTKAQRERDRWKAATKRALEHRDEWKARADQLRDERDDAVQSCIAVGRERDAAVARAENAERELAEEKRQHSDTIQVTDEQYTALMRERDDAVRERCYWKARAEEAEADLEELAEEFADFRAEVVAEAAKYRESHPHESNADPVVYAVRESDIAAVEVQAIDGGKWWLADGALVNMCESPTEGEAQEAVEDALATLVGALAARRAIKAEQGVDLIEEKAISAFKVAWHEADMHGDEGNRTRRGIRAARKVIEGDRK